LGHSSVVVTLDTYSKVMPGLKERAAARLEGVLQVKENPSAREG
ncbi:MAG: site-specific integrase, partial [Firmicutes bacterium]|nr:site-specific integrase [Bacillota bacterium]